MFVPLEILELIIEYVDCYTYFAIGGIKEEITKRIMIEEGAGVIFSKILEKGGNFRALFKISFCGTICTLEYCCLEMRVHTNHVRVAIKMGCAEKKKFLHMI